MPYQRKVGATPATQAATQPQPDQKYHKLRQVLGTGIRLAGGWGSNAGGLAGAGIGAGSELLAILTEGSWEASPEGLAGVAGRVGTEGAIGAIPFGKTLSAGRKALASGAKGAVFNTAADTMRQAAEQKTLTPEIDPLRLGFNAAMGGGVNAVFGHLTPKDVMPGGGSKVVPPAKVTDNSGNPLRGANRYSTSAKVANGPVHGPEDLPGRTRARQNRRQIEDRLEREFMVAQEAESAGRAQPFNANERIPIRQAEGDVPVEADMGAFGGAGARPGDKAAKINPRPAGRVGAEAKKLLEEQQYAEQLEREFGRADARADTKHLDRLDRLLRNKAAAEELERIKTAGGMVDEPPKQVTRSVSAETPTGRETASIVSKAPDPDKYKNAVSLDDIDPDAPRARYVGHQPDPDGGPGFPLYNIEGGPAHGSTVSAEGLAKYGIPVPATVDEAAEAAAQGRMGPLGYGSQADAATVAAQGARGPEGFGLSMHGPEDNPLARLLGAEVDNPGGAVRETPRPPTFDPETGITATHPQGATGTNWVDDALEDVEWRGGEDVPSKFTKPPRTSRPYTPKPPTPPEGGVSEEEGLQSLLDFLDVDAAYGKADAAGRKALGDVFGRTQARARNLNAPEAPKGPTRDVKGLSDDEEILTGYISDAAWNRLGLDDSGRHLGVTRIKEGNRWRVSGAKGPIEGLKEELHSRATEGAEGFGHSSADKRIFKKSFDELNKVLGGPASKKGGGSFTTGAFGGGVGDIIKKIAAENPDFARTVAGSAAGGVVGGMSDDEGSPIEGILMGMGAGAGAANVNKIPQLLQAAKVPEGASIQEAATKIFESLPHVQRFNYLADWRGLPANMWLGPYGSMATSAIEAGLSGDPRGWEVLKHGMNPITFLQDWKASYSDAMDLLKKGEVGHEIGLETAGTVKTGLALPGVGMTMGDIAARKRLLAAGFSEDEARRMTMTADPKSGYGQRQLGGKQSTLSDIIFPFKRTPINIAEEGARRTLGLGSFVNRRLDGQGPGFRTEAWQQGLGTAAGIAGYQAGQEFDDPRSNWQNMTRRSLSNLSGRYSLPVATGMFLGQTLGQDKKISRRDAERMSETALPAPGLDSIQDTGYWLASQAGMTANPSAKVPRGVLPQHALPGLEKLLGLGEEPPLLSRYSSLRRR